MMSKNKRQIVFLKYYSSYGPGILTKIIELFSSLDTKKNKLFHISANMFKILFLQYCYNILQGN